MQYRKYVNKYESHIVIRCLIDNGFDAYKHILTCIAIFQILTAFVEQLGVIRKMCMVN